MELISHFKATNCSICSNSFLVNANSYTHKTPFLLNCGHSACDKCLHSILASKNEVTCTVCEHVSTIPSKFNLHELGQHFPVNYFLLGLWKSNTSAAKANELDSLIKYSKPKTKLERKVICNECLDAMAISHCKQCGAPYCEVCFGLIHSHSRALRSHVQVPLLENYLNIEVGKPLMCSTHTFDKLEFFCISCHIPLCPRCMVENHQGHNIDLLENVKENCEDEFIDKYVKVTNVLQRMKSSHKQVEHILEECNRSKNLKDLHDEVFETFVHLHGKLTVYHHQVHSKLHFADEVGQLQSLKNTLQDAINSTEALLTSTKVLLKDSKLQKPNIFIAVIDNLKKKEALPSFLVENEGPTSSIPKLIINKDIMENFDKICDVKLPESLKYQLVTEDKLPPEYKKLPINEISRQEVTSIMANFQTSESSSICSDSLSDRIADQNLRSNTSSPVSSTSTSNVSHKTSDEPLMYLDELSVGCQVRVILCHLISPSDFYVQRECAVKKLADFQASLRPNILKQQKPPSKVTKGPFYLVLYEKDSKWYRARILDFLGKNEFTVLYVDFGNTEVVPLKRIRTMPRNVINMPALSIKCKLNNCVPINGEWDPEAVALMTKIVDNEYVSMVVKDKTPISFIVDLYKFTYNSVINIQQALCFFEYASAATECEWLHLPAMQHFRPNELRLPKLKVSEGDILEAHVSLVSSPQEFYVQNLYESKRLVKMAEELQRAYKNTIDNQPIYHPRKDMYVAAQYSKDNKWYRGKIVECLKGKLLQIFFIDFGAEETVPWDQVRTLYSKFSKLAPQAIKCSLCDILPSPGQDDWSAETCFYFHQKIFNSVVEVIVQKVEEDKINIVLYKSTPEADICLNALLVDENKAISTGINSTVAVHPKVVIGPNSKPKIIKKTSPLPIMEPVILGETSAVKENNLYSHSVKGPNGQYRFHVYVKRIVHPGEFYLTFAHKAESLLLLKENMQKHYKSVPYEKTEVEVDKGYAVLYNNKWYRGLLLKKQPENLYLVNLVDEALDVVIPEDCIFPLHESFANLEDGVFRCHLGGLEPSVSDKWPSSSINEMEDFITKHREILYFSKMGPLENESVPIELFGRIEKPAGPTEPVSYEWKSLNHYLRFIGLAKADGKVKWDCDGNILNPQDLDQTLDMSEVILSKPQKQDVPEAQNTTLVNLHEETDLTPTLLPTIISVPESWIPAKPLGKLSFVACPTYVDNDLNIYLHDFHESSSLLEEISGALSTKYEGTLPKPCDACLKAGDICVVRYHIDKKWYRGQILEYIAGLDEFLVQFVDYGNVESCKLVELRKIPVCTHIPIQATKCAFIKIEPVNADGKWKKEDIETVQYSLVDFRCQTELVNLPGETDIYGIKKIKTPDGKDFTAWLVQNGIAKYKKSRASLANDMLTEDEKSKKEDEEEVESSPENEKEAESSPGESSENENSDVGDSVENCSQTEKKNVYKQMDWFTMTEIELRNTASEESDHSLCVKDELSEEIEIMNIESQNTVPQLSHWSKLQKDEETLESENNTINVVQGNSLSEKDVPTETLDKSAEISTKKVEETVLQEEITPNEDLERKVAHWAELQLLSEDTLKYKEFIIPPDVNLLLVEATAFHTPTIIVVHLVDVEDNSEILEKISKFKMISSILQTEGPKQPLLSKPYKYKACCAKFSLDELWYRAFVIDETPNNDLVIQFVDFGNVEVLPSSSVRELKKEWADVEVMGLLCELYNTTLAKGANCLKVLQCLTETLESASQLKAIVKERTPSLKVELYKGDNLAYEELINQKFLIQV